MRNYKAHAPLRKIVCVLRPATSTFGKQRVALECGHEASASSGAIYRARCLKCAALAEGKE
jgi:hypothetical protein